MGHENDKTINEFVNNLKKDFKIDIVILFGSRARNDHLVDSDYDIIVVSPDFKDIHFLKRISQMHKYWPSDMALEVLGYTPEEFECKSKQLTIVKVAADEGIEIAA